jgi:hypothetical protein
MHSQSRVSQIASHHSSSAVSLSTTLDPTWAQAPLSSHCIQKLLLEINQLKMTVDLIEKVNSMLKANNAVSNAHCTIMRQAATTANTDLDHQKCTTH